MAHDRQRTLEATSPANLPFEKFLPINHFGGFHISYPRLSSAGGVRPFATVTDYENALERHAQAPRAFDQGIVRMREGMAAGVVQPHLTVSTMIDDRVLHARGQPGHHFQIMTAFENAGLPRFQRYSGFTADSEG